MPLERVPPGTLAAMALLLPRASTIEASTIEGGDHGPPGVPMLLAPAGGIGIWVLVILLVF